jgi:hypothetical protein
VDIRRVVLLSFLANGHHSLCDIHWSKLFFSSQVNLVQKYIANSQLDLKSLSAYLELGYVIDPDSMIKNIKAVKPGEIIIVDLSNNKIKSRQNFLPEAIKQRDKFAYMPFSLGQHRCIGEYFALMEIQMVLMRLYKNFKVELISNEPMEFTPLVTLKPKRSIELNLIRR